uniref:Retrotransposon Copia-like N-terminal domain-containing protein n=1 Tax=Solanum lycopersicum TaxID=4081 RepID=A0A3Q7HEA6_SOLLC
MPNQSLSNPESTPTVLVGGSSSRNKIDINHAFYLHSSDSPGMGLVSNIFDGKGYQNWKRSVLIALSAKNKLGFITGTHSAPGSVSGFKPNMGYPRVNNQQPPPPRYPKQNQRFKEKKKYNPNVSCTYYGKIGHIIDECYRLFGFPEDFNFTNEKNHSAPVRGNAAASMEEDDPNYYMDQVNQHMSREQFGHFIQVMKQMKIPESITKSAAADINANAIAVSFPVSSNVSSNVRLWHVRLGHLPYTSMKNDLLDSKDSTITTGIDFFPIINVPVNSPVIDTSPVQSTVPSEHVASPSPIPVRRSHRTNIGTLPSHLKDYICNTIYLSDVTDSCLAVPSNPSNFSYANLSQPSQMILNNMRKLGLTLFPSNLRGDVEISAPSSSSAPSSKKYSKGNVDKQAKRKTFGLP